MTETINYNHLETINLFLYLKNDGLEFFLLVQNKK